MGHRCAGARRPARHSCLQQMAIGRRAAATPGCRHDRDGASRDSRRGYGRDRPRRDRPGRGGAESRRSGRLDDLRASVLARRFGGRHTNRLQDDGTRLDAGVEGEPGNRDPRRRRQRGRMDGERSRAGRRAAAYSGRPCATAPGEASGVRYSSHGPSTVRRLIGNAFFTNATSSGEHMPVSSTT